MPYILINLGPSTPENRYGFRPGFDERGASQVAIKAYQFTGLPGLGTVFVEFDGQPTTQVLGGAFTNSFPLFNATGPAVYHQYNPPLLITEGDNQWNGSHLITVSLYDGNHNPLVFTTAQILLTFVPVDPRDATREVNQVKRHLISELVSRNVHPLPRINELAHINSDLQTDYPYRS